jgi:hypothetical protein
MERSNSISEALTAFPVHNPPSLLYRFYGPPASLDNPSEGTLSALIAGKLKLTPPLAFNDPFEMWAGITDEGLTEETVIRSLMSEKGLFRLAVAAHNPAALQDIEGYRLALIQAIRTKPESRFLHLKSCVTAIAGTMGEEIGVSCFAAFNEVELHGELGIRHWAMYGGEHRGFAIGYSGNHEVIQSWAHFKWLFPVDYRDQRLLARLDEFDSWNDAKMWQIFRSWGAMKSRRAWGDEKEWRLLCSIGAGLPDGVLTHEKRANGTMHFLNLWGDARNSEERHARASIIDRVILGARASQPLKDAILTAVRAPHLRHIQIWEVAPCDRNFQLLHKRIA